VRAYTGHKKSICTRGVKSRGTGSVTEVEQYRNDIAGDVENTSPSPCRIKKATEGGPLATDAHGAKCSLNNRLHQPHYTSPDSPPPLVTSFTSAAITARPGASRPPQTRRHGGRRAKRQQQARELAAQEAGGGEATAAGRETSGKSETMSNSPGLSAVSTVREGLPLHLHISATAEQGSSASQE
jgi:hypothetical protein